MVEIEDVVIKLPPPPGTLPLLAIAAEEGPDAVPDEVIWLLSETEPECEVVVRLPDIAPDDTLPDSMLEPALTDKLDSLCEVTDAVPLERTEPSVTVPDPAEEAA